MKVTEWNGHSVRGVPYPVPAWTVRYEDNKPPGRGYVEPHVVRIWRYAHEKTARNRYKVEIGYSYDPSWDVRISLTDPNENEIDLFRAQDQERK